MLIIREYTKHSKQNYILQTLQPAVGTIGVFDGMHRGHRFLLDQVKEEAMRRGCLSMVVTFAEHPRSVVHRCLCGARFLTTHGHAHQS